jgi:hypothetical protein
MADPTKRDPVATAAHELTELQAFLYGARAIVEPDGCSLSTEMRTSVDVILREVQARIEAIAERLDTHATATRT